MFNFQRIVTLLMAMVFCLGTVGVAHAASDKVYNLNMTGGYMDRHPTVQNAFIPWAERIKQRTNGKVVITYFNPNTLGPEGENFELARKGQIDIGHNHFARNPGRLLVSSVGDIPTEFTHPPAFSVALWRMYNEIPEMQKEFEGLKVLAFHSSAPVQFDWVIDKNITNVADVKGKKVLVASGEQARMVRAMGGNPMIIPVTDYYLSLSRNMADGCILPIAPLRSFKISEALKSITVCSYSVAGWWIGMNQNTWNSLPKEYQDIIMEESGEKLSYMGGRSIWDGDQVDVKFLQEQGVKMNVPSPEERAEWIRIATPAFKDEWFKKMSQRKLPAQDIYDKAYQIRKDTAGIDVMPYSYTD
ncbi:TRAP transporter substrate-binding protein DctP [Desulfovibrio sp. OttesenSCG-928-F07]|nr:TRAP transporter substrate-binding protein DctP [Desulfovibrio sp. OttesenSCG-928-F07]